MTPALLLRRQRPTRRRRRAAVLAATLVCVLVVMAMLGHMLLAVVQSGRQLHVERNRRQCDLLLQAGVSRATLRRAQDADYRGETWSLPSAEILGSGDGQVTIEFSPGENSQPARLHVIAEYPTGSERSVRRSRTVSLETQASPSAEE